MNQQERPVYGVNGIISISKSDLFCDTPGNYVRRLGEEIERLKKENKRLNSCLVRIWDEADGLPSYLVKEIEKVTKL